MVETKVRSRISRRGLISGIAAMASISGCLGLPGDSDTAGTDADSTSTVTTESTDTTADGTTTTGSTAEGTGDLDLREANVLEVAVESVGPATDGFDVTLYHDDEGEEGYADWWQVETLSGEQLGRRTLLHAHGTQPFTRSEQMDVPSGVTCVVVRGHDQTHGYGGRAVLVNLESGDSRAVDQGTEPQSFESSDCP